MGFTNSMGRDCFEKIGPSGERLRKCEHVEVWLPHEMCEERFVMCRLPSVGRQVVKGECIAMIETGKAVFDYEAPFSGKIVYVQEPVNGVIDVQKAAFTITLDDEQEWDMLEAVV